jgi:Ca2+:H+ antiporter
MVPPRSSGNDLNAALSNSLQGGTRKPVNIAGLTNEENAHLVRGVAEVAAAAATAAVQDAQRHHAVRKAPAPPTAPQAVQAPPRPPFNSMPTVDDDLGAVGDTAGDHGGHDAPNWGRMKSSVILLGATVLYAVVAEILVNTVDVVLENLDIDEKFLGITLFALVPNTTEFLVRI